MKLSEIGGAVGVRRMLLASITSALRKADEESFHGRIK